MIDEPQSIQVESDQLIFAYGRMAWYFLVDYSFYWVTRPEFFKELPSLETLRSYRIQDRHRLWQWLKARDRGEAVLHSTPCWGKDKNWGPNGFNFVPSAKLPPPVELPPPVRRPRFNPQYDPWQFEHDAERRAEDEKEKEQRAAFLNEVRREQEVGVSMERRYLNALRPESKYKYRRPGHMASSKACGGMIATFLNDHHYIQAMFDVYTQQRTRLL